LSGEDDFTFKSNAMEMEILKGAWKDQKGKLKIKFGWLTDNDLICEEGKEEVMFGKLQIKLGKTKEQLHAIIAAL
jgi:uncharacterized protein YjbJ (UPF0337 family)